MESCSSCSNVPDVIEIDREVATSSGRLADLLGQTPEFQEYIHQTRRIDLDSDVKSLLAEIRKQQMMSMGSEADETIRALQSELECLPSVQAYRKAEAEVRGLFHLVDQVISASAGIGFAQNALSRGCG